MAQDDQTALLVSLEARVDSFEKAFNRASQVADSKWSAIEKRTKEAGDRMSEAMGDVGDKVAKVFAGVGIGLGLSELIEMADAYSKLQTQINNAVGSQEKGAAAMERLNAVARQTYTSIDQVGNAFAQNSTILTSLGFSTNTQIRYQQALTEALKLSGTEGDKAAEVQNILTRALETGSLSGKQLATVMTDASVVAQALATGLGVPVAKLNLLGQQGKITSDVIVQSLVGSLTKLNAAMSARPATMADAITVLKNAISDYVGRTAQASGVTATFVNSATFLASHFNNIADGALAAAAILASSYVPVLARAAAAQLEVVATNPFLALATAIGAAVVWLNTFGADIKPIQGDVATLGDYSAAVWADMKSGAQTAAQIATQAFVSMASLISEALGGTSVSMQDLEQYAIQAANVVIGAFKLAYDNVVITWTKLPAAVADAAISAMNAMIGMIEGALNTIIAGVNKAVDAINSVGNAAGVNLGQVGSVSLGRIANAYAGAGDAAGKAYAAALQDAASTDVGKALSTLKAQADEHAKERLAEAAKERAADQSLNAPDNPINPQSSKDANAFEAAMREQQQNLQKLQAEMAERQSLAGSGADPEQIQAAVSRAETAQNLLNKAQQAGLDINDQLVSRIATLADTYSKASAEAQALAKSEQEAQQRAQELSTAGEGFFKTFVNDIVQGKSASDALRAALTSLSEKMLDMGMNSLWESMMNSGGKSVFNSLGNLFAPAVGIKPEYAPGSSLAGLQAAAKTLNAATVTMSAGVVNLSGAGVGGLQSVPGAMNVNVAGVGGTTLQPVAETASSLPTLAQPGVASLVPGAGALALGGAGVAAGALDNSSQSAFINTAYQKALSMGMGDAQARLAASQAAQETGFGLHVPGNNLFGIKASPGQPSQTLMTTENVDGQNISIPQNFRAYDSVDSSFADYQTTLQKDWPGAANAPTFDQALQGLKIGQPGGYATDPNYLSELTKNNSLINPQNAASSLQAEASSAEQELTQNTQKMASQFQSAVPQFAQLGSSATSLTGPLSQADSGINAFGSSIGSLSKDLTADLGGVAGPGSLAFADGGAVRGPGSGTSDSIPAYLSDGEFVVNAEATRKHGALLNAINSGRVPKFASGGFVSARPANSNESGAGATFGDLYVNVNTTGSSGNSQQDQAHAQMVGKAISDALDQKLGDWARNQMRPGGMINQSTLRRMTGSR